MCKNEGWELAGFYHNDLYIFRTKNEDSTDIMTDENEKFKIIAKRVLLQPGYLGLNLWVVYRFFDIFVLRTRFEGMIETNISDCLGILFIIFCTTYTLIRLIDFFIWYVKSKKLVKKGEKIPFLTLKEHEQNNIAHWIMIMVNCVLFFIAYIFLYAAYLEFSWLLWLVGGIMATLAVQGVYNRQKNKGKKASKTVHMVAIIVALVFLAGVNFTVQYSRQIYCENAKTMLNYEGIPVSFSDLGFEKESCTDESDVDATGLAQLYYFKSESEQAQEEMFFTSWMEYEVLVSDYEFIRQKYINEIFADHNKYENIVVQVNDDDTSWDKCWYVDYGADNKKYENLYSGFAVKDNIVIKLEGYVQTKGQDFFEVAYEKLFLE